MKPAAWIVTTILELEHPSTAPELQARLGGDRRTHYYRLWMLRSLGMARRTKETRGKTGSHQARVWCLTKAGRLVRRHLYKQKEGKEQ